MLKTIRTLLLKVVDDIDAGNTNIEESDAIADSLGLSLNKEAPAYLQGDTTMELAQIICKLGCKKCGRKTKSLKNE